MTIREVFFGQMSFPACFIQIVGGHTGPGRYNFSICRSTSGVIRCSCGGASLSYNHIIICPAVLDWLARVFDSRGWQGHLCSVTGNSCCAEY